MHQTFVFSSCTSSNRVYVGLHILDNKVLITDVNIGHNQQTIVYFYLTMLYPKWKYYCVLPVAIIYSFFWCLHCVISALRGRICHSQIMLKVPTDLSFDWIWSSVLTLLRPSFPFLHSIHSVFCIIGAQPSASYMSSSLQCTKRKEKDRYKKRQRIDWCDRLISIGLLSRITNRDVRR